MKLKGLNVSVIVGAFVITLGIIVGMRYLAFRTQVEKPLRDFLRNSRVVRSYSITETKAGSVLEVTLADVDDLRETYLDLRDGARSILGHRLKAVVVKDAWTKELGEVYYRAHFAIYEAISTGNFRDMAVSIGAEAKKARLDRYRVRVDGDNVYLQLHKGPHYLYEIVPRVAFQPPISIPAQTGAGGAGPGPW
ncbi:MAG: hypothetical protein HPY71_05190 [Firmicutes bacterium]|nr:hypothetical protein [Bacillota bacterium]